MVFSVFFFTSNASSILRCRVHHICKFTQKKKGCKEYNKNVLGVYYRPLINEPKKMCAPYPKKGVPDTKNYVHHLSKLWISYTSKVDFCVTNKKKSVTYTTIMCNIHQKNIRSNIIVILLGVPLLSRTKNIRSSINTFFFLFWSGSSANTIRKSFRVNDIYLSVW